MTILVLFMVDILLHFQVAISMPTPEISAF